MRIRAAVVGCDLFLECLCVFLSRRCAVVLRRERTAQHMRCAPKKKKKKKVPDFCIVGNEPRMHCVMKYCVCHDCSIDSDECNWKSSDGYRAQRYQVLSDALWWKCIQGVSLE